jgi:hypothetical protein
MQQNSVLADFTPKKQRHDFEYIINTMVAEPKGSTLLSPETTI